MATLADSLVSSSARVLAVRMRPDLIAKQQRYLGQLYWVIKEPLGLHYFRFQEGRTSLDEIKVEFERRFPPEKVTVEELGNFVGTLHRNGLVTSNVAGQGEQLIERRRKQNLRKLGGAFASMLAIRFKGIDPERLLESALDVLAPGADRLRRSRDLGARVGDGAVRSIPQQAADV